VSNEAWQTIEAKELLIEAKEPSIEAKEPSIEIAFHFVDERERVATTGDHFSSTTEHGVEGSVTHRAVLSM
jgi:hypothetical protein